MNRSRPSLAAVVLLAYALIMQSMLVGAVSVMHASGAADPFGVLCTPSRLSQSTPATPIAPADHDSGCCAFACGAAPVVLAVPVVALPVVFAFVERLDGMSVSAPAAERKTPFSARAPPVPA